MKLPPLSLGSLLTGIITISFIENILFRCNGVDRSDQSQCQFYELTDLEGTKRLEYLAFKEVDNEALIEINNQSYKLISIQRGRFVFSNKFGNYYLSIT